MIHVKVAQVGFYDKMGFVVLLRSLSSEKTLPIFIGAPEAQAIAIIIQGVHVPRPLTHDLFKNVLDNAECRMQKAVICDLKDNTFFAKLFLEINGVHTQIDARPSDAIALALRFKAPIYVEDNIMEKAGVIIENQVNQQNNSDFHTDSSESDPKKILKQKIDNAVKEERYEEAAKLRDELNKLRHNTN
jgi:uncharacterized protein